MTYLYSILIMGASLYIGYYISRKYAYREKLLSNMLELATQLKNNLSYRKDNIINVFDSFIESLASEMEKPFLILKDVAINQVEQKKVSVYLSCLKKEERNIIYSFFKELGQSNESVENENIESFKSQIEKMKCEATDTKKKNQPLAIKLSLAIGLILSILII